MKKLKHMTEPELRHLMVSMAHAIETIAQQMNVERPHFCLVVFNDPKVTQYIGNCERPGMIQAMRETAERLEKRQDVPR